MFKLKLKLLLCVILSLARYAASEVEKRSHHDPWAPRDCWDHGANFLMNPFCPILKACSRPPTIQHGSNSEPELSLHGIEVTYTCNTGYSMVGGALVTCAATVDTPTAEWGPVPSCVKLCPSPPAIISGSVSAPELLVPGSQANYTCDDGYRFDGGSTITCQGTGSWTSPTPVCVPIACPPAPAIDFGFPATNDTDVGTLVEYQCIENYNFDSNVTTLTCLPGAKWSRPLPVCVPTVCPPPPSIDFGSSATNDTDVGTLVEYQCIENYNFENVSTVTCLPGGTWSKPLPVCLPPDCYPIPTIDYARPVGSKWSTVLGSSVSYVCEDGYEFTDVNSTTCLITSYWSVLPECVPVITGCGPFPTVAYANITESTNGTDVGAIAQYECVSGFQLLGNDTVECLPTYVWSATPECSLTCEDLPVIEFGHAIGLQALGNDSFYQYYSNGTEVTYVCDAGYALAGPSVVECLNGNWSQAPSCTPLCSDIDIVFLVDGSGSVGSFGFEDTRQFLRAMVDLYPETTTRVGLATFSTNVTLEFNLDQYEGDRAGLLTAIENTPYPTGNTNTWLALEYARTNMFTKANGMRPGALRALVVVTDGESLNTTATRQQARLLHQQGVTVYSVGVGIETDAAELRGIASRPSYVFNVDQYAAITTVSGPLSEATCNVTPGTPLPPGIQEDKE